MAEVQQTQSCLCGRTFFAQHSEQILNVNSLIAIDTIHGKEILAMICLEAVPR
jgi:molybdopterin-binding protein